MKKFGLRALAGGLALLMVAGLSAPATAKAQDDLLILAPNKELKVLEITKDMVDDDGEIVISGGEYDRIVVSKDAAAADIYFDQVVVKDLVVESGNKATVQLWEVDAEKVTVQEPEVEEIPVEVLLPLLEDELTYQIAMDMYHANKAYVENALKTAPSIVTMEDAKVDSLVVRANAKLDLAEGDVAVVALEASDKIERAKVTLKNYEGDVTYKGSDNFNSMTLQNVDSRINNLKVDESYGSNYFTVTAKDSVVLNAEVAGNAQVTLNAPMGTVEVSEEASAAKVVVLSTADELKISANDAKVELTKNATIANAAITGDNVYVEGDGILDAAEITGTGAYVSTSGTEVEGENTYVPPAAPEKPKVVITDINLTGGDKAVVTKNADGSSTVVYTPNYQTASFVVPDSVDKDRIGSVDIELIYNGQFCVKFGGTSKGDEYPGWGTTEATKNTLSYSINAAKDKLARIDFMCLEAPLEITVKKITFNLLDKAPEAEPIPEASAPGALSDKYLVYNVADLNAGGYGYSASEAAHGGVTYTYNDQYQEVQYTLPAALNVSDLSKMIVTMSYTTGEIAFKLLGTDHVWYGKTAQDTTDIEVDLTGRTGSVTGIGLMAGSGACDATVYRIAFLPKEGVTIDPNPGTTPDPTPEVTPDPTPEVTPAPTPDEEDALQKKYLVGDNLTEDWGNADCVIEGGKATLTFDAKYEEKRFKLPEVIDLSKVESIVYHLESQSAPMNFYIMVDAETNEKINFYYNVDKTEYTHAITGKTEKIDSIGVQVGVEDFTEETAVFLGVTFNMKEDAENEEPDLTPEVTVEIAEPATTTLTLDDTLVLTANVTTGSAVTWKSSKPEVAIVDANGVVTPVGNGEVVISAVCGDVEDSVELTVENAFYLKNAEAFSLTVGADNGVAILSNYYMDGSNFSGKLPTVLKNDAAVSAKFETMAGIVEVVDSFEFSITLTEGTAKANSWEPQVEVVVQGNGAAGDYTGSTYKNQWVNVGEPSEGSPKTATTTFYVANQTFDDASAAAVTWTDAALGQLALSVKNAAADSAVVGTYTIKVNLK